MKTVFSFLAIAIALSTHIAHAGSIELTVQKLEKDHVEFIISHHLTGAVDLEHADHEVVATAQGAPVSLIFDLDGSGQPAPKRYRLKMQGSEVVQTPIVSTQTGRAEAGTLVGTIRYSLETLDGAKVVTEGVATSTATYDRSVQRFASQRAARDAEIRLAKVLAEQIKTRIASILVTRP